MTQLDMGKDLRDAALEQSKQGREARIDAVRERLKELRNTVPYAFPDWELTADDVWLAAQHLGLAEGDLRWLSHVTRHWDLVINTHRYVPSRLKQRHARPIPVFRWV